MTWTKEQFLISVKDGNDNEIYRKYVNGITSTIETIKVGIHKSEATKDWIITDCGTGYVIHITITQKAAKQWVEDTAEMIEEVLNTPKRDKIVKEVNRCKIRQ